MNSLTSLPPFAPSDLSAVVAVDEDGKELTFAAWDDRANRFAEGLVQLGIGAGDRIAVRMHTGLEWLVVNLGIAKLRAEIVAINYRFTVTEALPVLRDSRAQALVLDDDNPAPFCEAAKSLGLTATIRVGTGGGADASYGDILRHSEPRARIAKDLADMIIYSSGTTGNPKGVALAKRRAAEPAIMAEYVRSMAFDGAAGGRGSRSLVSLPMHHGVGPGFVKLSLSMGGSLVLQRRFDAERALALIERHRVTHMTCVPTMITRILDLPPNVRQKYDTSSLRFLQIGGAPVGAALKQRAIDLFGDCLHESYGAIETGLIAGATPAEQSTRRGTVGRAFRHVSIRIIGEQGQLLGPRESGEILVRTPIVIMGYEGMGPFGPDKLDAEGFYHTGDVGYLDDEGYLFINDRLSEMIIAGGSNIYPAEIEQVLSQHPAVAVAAVVGVPHADLGEQPEAYIEFKPGATATEKELIGFCEGRLAKYKWPRRVHVLDTIPVNTGGKILRRELRALNRAQLNLLDAGRSIVK